MIEGIAAVFFNFICLFLKISDIDRFPPPLSKEEEVKLFEMAREGDLAAREKLITHNLRLVAHIAKKYTLSGYSQDELISTGSVGLIKAVDTYKPDSGVRFATYASKCLQNEILMQFRCGKKLSGEISINEAIDTDKDGNPLTYGDMISVDDTIAEDIDLRECSSRAMSFVLMQLSQREREIMIKRYGLDGSVPETQKKVAQSLGISRSYVSRIEKSAIEKLRAYMKRHGYGE